ncbi:MAG: isochorismate synthase [Armatimonadota bacterium]|nr:isochorismate synthase [Armatimonadota bacterium]MDR5696888.1 isochorismate synthase [Armatimonadota bacterium]
MKAAVHAAPIPADALERLERHHARARQLARRTGQPTLAWVAHALERTAPPDVFARTPDQPRWLWSRPADGFELLGVGIAWRAVTRGPRRFDDAGAAWKRLVEQSVGDAPAESVAFGGFSFAPQGPYAEEWAGFPPGEVAVPRLAVVTEGGRIRIVLAAAALPDEDGSTELGATLSLAGRLFESVPRAGWGRGQATITAEHPAAPAWKRAVADSAGAVREGILRKVVLARRVELRLVSCDPARMLAHLADAHPHCTVFAVEREGAVFCGATPERLVRVGGGWVEAMALAGSAPRGRNPDEDAALAQTLVASAKERDEHAAVVEWLREALGGVSEEISVATAPDVLQTTDVQHLHTGLRGRLRSRAGILEVAGRLHPTPAVAGVPAEAALAWIRSCEPLDRGWYAGAVGWTNGKGEGEFAVAIRSALVRDRTAFVFAGCGIVAGSDQDREYEESQIKMRPMLRALGVR